MCCLIAEKPNTSPGSSVCASLCSSEDCDVTEAPARQKSSPSLTSDCHPLNLTKRKDETSVSGTPVEEHYTATGVISGPVFSPKVGSADSPVLSKSRPSSFSLKTSPSRFLGSPADKRRGWSRAPRPIDGWSELGRGTVGTLQPAYDNDPMLSTASSVLDRVSLISCPFLLS